MDYELCQLNLLYGESYLKEKNDVNMMAAVLAWSEGHGEEISNLSQIPVVW